VIYKITKGVQNAEDLTYSVTVAHSYGVIIEAAKITVEQKQPSDEAFLHKHCSICRTIPLENEEGDTVREESICDCDTCGEHTSCIACGLCYTCELYSTRAWKDDPAIASLAFSKMWVFRFLTRNDFHRRKITSSSASKEPPLPEIHAGVLNIYDTIIRGKYDPSCIISADETGISFGISPIHAYI